MQLQTAHTHSSSRGTRISSSNCTGPNSSIPTAAGCSEPLGPSTARHSTAQTKQHRVKTHVREFVYVHLQVPLRTKLDSWRPNWPALLDMADAQLRARFRIAPAWRPVPVLACGREGSGGWRQHVASQFQRVLLRCRWCIVPQHYPTCARQRTCQY